LSASVNASFKVEAAHIPTATNLGHMRRDICDECGHPVGTIDNKGRDK